MRVLLKISYLGTNYHGWQVQPNGITVQETLQNALEQLYQKRPALTGCSRTDSGVHAKEFYCHFDTEKHIPENNVINALNTMLPNDIAVLSCEYVEDDFHARYSSKGKEYIYQIYNAQTPNPFLYETSWHINRKLDIIKMNKFANDLIGKHDFIAFSSSGRTVTDTVRTVEYCTVETNDDIITIKVRADGFLYNMVRIIVGTLVDVSDGKIDVDSALKIIESKDRSLAGFTAPPKGLFLNRVFF